MANQERYEFSDAEAQQIIDLMAGYLEDVRYSFEHNGKLRAGIVFDH